MLGENVAMTPKPKESYLPPDSKENIQCLTVKRTNFSASAEQLNPMESWKDQSQLTKNEYDSDFKLLQGTPYLLALHSLQLLANFL